MKDQTIIIRTYNRLVFTQFCLRAIQAYTDFSRVEEVLIGDCHSTDGTESFVRRSPWARVYEAPYGNVTANLQIGLSLSRARNVIVVDNDIFVAPDWNYILGEVFTCALAHGIRVLAYDTGDTTLKNSTGAALRVGFRDYRIQPVACVGGRIVAPRELFDEANVFGRLGGVQGQYNGWWQWHQGFLGQIGVLLPRLGCFDMGRFERPGPGDEYTRHRRGEPLVEEFLRAGPDRLKAAYVRAGWMRDAAPPVPDLRGSAPTLSSELARRKEDEL